MEPADLICYSLPFWMPVILGVFLLLGGRAPSAEKRLYLLAGLLTLKPIVTTPIWFRIANEISNWSKLQPAHFYSLVPGAGLSLLTVLLFWQLFTGPNARVAWTLLVLDSLRWFNSFLFLSMGGLSRGRYPDLAGIFALLGLLGPSIYSVCAQVGVAWARDRGQRA
jgi:hypothetical protein